MFGLKLMKKEKHACVYQRDGRAQVLKTFHQSLEEFNFVKFSGRWVYLARALRVA